MKSFYLDTQMKPKYKNQTKEKKYREKIEIRQTDPP